MISNRGKQLIQAPTPPLVKAHFACAADPYHAQTNPQGYINLGTAENRLMDLEILEKVRGSCTVQEDDLHYKELYGAVSFRQALAGFFSQYFGMAQADPDNIVVSSGASAICEALSYSLFDDNDGLIIPTPLYPGFLNDFTPRFKVRIIPCPLEEENNFALNPNKLEQTILDAQKQGTNVKAILINNPQNPVGITFSKEILEAVIILAKKYSLHIIADEIYAQSNYNRSSSFTSLCNLDTDYQDHIHLVYGFAKDFSLSGFKVGVYYSINSKLTQAMKEIAYFHPVSTLTQRCCENIIGDKAFLTTYFAKNNEKLAENARTTESLLKDKLKVSVVPGQAGIFLWINFGRYLYEPSFTAEQALFTKIFEKAKVSISPGQYFLAQTPGWFRLCFAREQAVVAEAVRRMQKVLED